MKAKFLLPLAGVLAIGAGIGAAIADGHSEVEQREAAMKVVGKSTGTIGKMLKGETEFSADEANTALAAMKEAATGFGDLFPDGTELQGSNEFKAAPAIWTDGDGFSAEVVKFAGAIDAAIAANPQDKAALGAVFGTIGQSCKSCHEDYRVKQ